MPIRARRANDPGVRKEASCDWNEPVGCRNSRYYATVANRCESLDGHVDERGTAAREQAQRRIAGGDRANRHGAARGDHVVPPPAAAELISITPCRHFGTLWASDSHKLESLAHAREADVVRRHAERRASEETLTLFDRLPAFFQRSEIPAFARSTDDPQPALLLIEREPASDGEMLNYFVRAEVAMTEQAG